MHAHAHAPRYAADPIHDSFESVIAAVGQPARQPRANLTTVLMQYWQALAIHDAPTRRDWLDATLGRVRRGATSPRAFVVFTLGDVDEDIVFDAVTEFVGTHPVSVERRQAAVAQAVDWVRRGLALNRGAVFSALLACGDPVIDESLAGLRLLLRNDEVEAICRRAAAHASGATRTFLSEWLELLDACTPCDTAARRSVASALETIAG